MYVAVNAAVIKVVGMCVGKAFGCILIMQFPLPLLCLSHQCPRCLFKMVRIPGRSLSTAARTRQLVLVAKPFFKLVQWRCCRNVASPATRARRYAADR